jgi:uridine kinase
VGARVIVVAGPSGSGKSRLCDRLADGLGLPVVNLDDFYKDGDDPTLPRVALPGGGSIVDWDDPASWLPDEAMTTLLELCESGRAELPVYDIAHDGRVGRQTVELGPAAYVVVEGVFADEVVAPCRAAALLADAVCVDNGRLVTFWRRLSRDLREGRKPPWVLVRRGLALMRREPDVLARASAAGCVLATSDGAYDRLHALVTGR